MEYIHQLPNWPSLQWNEGALLERLSHVRYRQGQLISRMEGMGFKLREESVLKTLTQDILRSSEIEGEYLDQHQVRSSVARRLGMDVAGLIPADHHIEGVVEMMLNATQQWNQALSAQRLFSWHAALFPSGYSGMNKITVAGWRDDRKGPMQVVSGSIGREKTHFQAPNAHRLPQEMKQFLNWFNAKKPQDPVMIAGIAHLWFITIHPFDDGNGRIARAIADLALARSEESSQRFYSLTAQIQIERYAYYDILERTQKGGLDISAWLIWFLECLDRAIDNANETLHTVLAQSYFWKNIRQQALNPRQHMMIQRVLNDFEGKLSSSKWAKMAKCSQDTASRDIADLVSKGILIPSAAGGRSTSYAIPASLLESEHR